MRIQHHREQDEKVDFNGFYLTGFTVAGRRAQTDHRRNWAALLLMFKQGVFSDRWLDTIFLTFSCAVH